MIVSTKGSWTRSMMLVSALEVGTSEGKEIDPQRHRRVWTAAEKQRLVAETLEPGASVSRVARRHDMNANLLFTWRRQARQGELGNNVPAAAPEGLQLIPIEVAAAGEAQPPRRVPSGEAHSGIIEIALPSGVRVRVGALVDELALRRVLTALRSAL
jgi:transposase